MAFGGAARYLPGMADEHGHPRPPARSATFSRAEIRWLGAVVIAAVVVSATAAMVSDKTITDLLHGGSAPAPQQPNADN